eukprot:1161232-Pelagomonas_calceolata.AAC.5
MAKYADMHAPKKRKCLLWATYRRLSLSTGRKHNKSCKHALLQAKVASLLVEPCTTAQGIGDSCQPVQATACTAVQLKVPGVFVAATSSPDYSLHSLHLAEACTAHRHAQLLFGRGMHSSRAWQRHAQLVFGRGMHRGMRFEQDQSPPLQRARRHE